MCKHVSTFVRITAENPFFKSGSSVATETLLSSEGGKNLNLQVKRFHYSKNIFDPLRKNA